MPGRLTTMRAAPTFPPQYFIRVHPQVSALPRLNVAPSYLLLIAPVVMVKKLMATPASDSLLPKPANLLASRFTDQRLSAVLWNGLYGSAMPAWREYSERDLRNLVAFIQQQP